jgi:hypothetical protein
MFDTIGKMCFLELASIFQLSPPSKVGKFLFNHNSIEECVGFKIVWSNHVNKLKQQIADKKKVKK